MAEAAILLSLAGLGVAIFLVFKVRAGLEEKHRQMLGDLHAGLAQQSDRVASRLSEEMGQTRDSLHRLQIALGASLGETGEKLNAKMEARLDQISGKVS